MGVSPEPVPAFSRFGSSFRFYKESERTGHETGSLFLLTSPAGSRHTI